MVHVYVWEREWSALWVVTFTVNLVNAPLLFRRNLFVQYFITPMHSRVLRLLDHLAQRLVGSAAPSLHAADPFAGMLPWELTTRTALNVPRLGAGGGVDTAYAAALLDFAGVCTFQRAVDPELVARCRATVDSVAGNVRSRARRRHGVDPDQMNDGFELEENVYQRSVGRIDLRNHEMLASAPFDADVFDAGAHWMPLIRRVLGEEATLLWKGIVVAEPGTGEQAFHADGPLVPRDVWHARDAHTSACGSVPAHSLAVFVPLVDYHGNGGDHGDSDRESGGDYYGRVSADSVGDGPYDGGVGATLFLPGSHHQLTADALQAEAVEAGSTAGAGIPAALDVSAGDAIVFDLRTHHVSTQRHATRTLIYSCSLSILIALTSLSFEPRPEL